MWRLLTGLQTFPVLDRAAALQTLYTDEKSLAASASILFAISVAWIFSNVEGIGDMPRMLNRMVWNCY